MRQRQRQASSPHLTVILQFLVARELRSQRLEKHDCRDEKRSPDPEVSVGSGSYGEERVAEGSDACSDSVPEEQETGHVKYDVAAGGLAEQEPAQR